MRVISKKVVCGKTIIVTETKGWFKKKIRTFEAQKEFPAGYWEWLELPDCLLVPDALSLQLNAWKGMGVINKEVENDEREKE